MTTDRSVIEICYEVGYNSLGSFTRRFTDLFGISPLRFRSIARSGAELAVDQLLERGGAAYRPAVEGQIGAPADFMGLIFIGLFETSMPQGKPVACAIACEPGGYQIATVPDGRFYLFAAGFRQSEDPRVYLHYDSALRAGGQAIVVSDGVAQGAMNLFLRPPAVSDPPMLLTLPLLTKRYLDQSRTAVDDRIQSAKSTGGNP
jgi:hypothetical protein